MKKVICTLLALLLLVPMGSIGEAPYITRYHDLYEAMKIDNSEFTWEQFKEVMDGGDVFHEFPDFQIKVYDPLDCVDSIDEHYQLSPAISRHFERYGFALSKESLQIQFNDQEQRAGFIITKVLNPDFEGCDVPINEQANANMDIIYEEHTFQINGMSCACTWYTMYSVGGEQRVVAINALLRVSDDNVLLIRASYEPDRDFNGSSLEELAPAAFMWEKGLSYLLALCPLD